MSETKIGEMLENVEKCKELKKIEYLFRKPEVINARKVYEEYKQDRGLNNYEDSIAIASEYIKFNKNSLELAMISEYSDVMAYANQEKQLKELLAMSLDSLFNAMSKSGIIDILIRKHNDMCEENNIESLNVSDQQITNEFNVKVNSRDKFAMLYLKNAFWLNEYTNVLRTLYSVQSLDKSIEGENIEDRDLNYLLYMNERKNDILEEIFKLDISANSEGQVAFSICDEYGEDYKRIFRDIFPNVENDMYEDYKTNLEFEAAIGDISQKKNALLIALLKHQILEAKQHTLNPSIKQWGMYKEGDMYMLGVEPDGYMLPATFPIPHYLYSDVLLSLQMKSYTFPEFLPIKQIYRDKSFATNLLVRPTPEQIKEIKLELKQGGEQKGFLKRVLEQINGKIHSYSSNCTIEIYERE